jgi:PKD repeat protein
VNGYGNNVFLDNVQVYDLGATAPVAAISASATSDVCVLDTVYFAAVNPGNALAQWTFGPGAVPSVATGPGNHAVYFFSAGPKTVTLQLNGAGGTDRDTISLTAVPDVSGAWSFQTDSAYIFRGQATVSQGTALGYLWDFGDGTTSTTASVRHVYAAAGTYPVQLTVDGPCNDVAFSTNAVISSVGLDEPELGFAVSPNPTDGLLRVEGVQRPEAFRIIDLAGRLVSAGRWPAEDLIDVRSLSAGSYVLELQHEGRSQRILVVKR